MEKRIAGKAKKARFTGKAYFGLNAVMILATRKITIILRHIYFYTKIGIKTGRESNPAKFQDKKT